MLKRLKHKLFKIEKAFKSIQKHNMILVSTFNANSRNVPSKRITRLACYEKKLYERKTRHSNSTLTAFKKGTAILLRPTDKLAMPYYRPDKS
jgi:hypothetical protein